MAFDSRSLDDYIDVAERMTEFYDRYPEGSLRAADPAHPWEMAIVTGNKKDGTPTTQTFIVYSALAYRHPGDPAPGVGVAWEIFPGRTPYTLGSELMNAETSAWGRAMAALGIATKRGIATRQEVRNRRAERDDGLPVNADGSLSRSQTTDAEKDTAGVMTSEQLAEHTALRKGIDGKLPPSEQGSRTPRVPADDPWYGIPGAGAPPAVPAEERPNSADAGQIREINIRLGGLGITERAVKLAWLSDWARRPVKSSKDLSMTEAAELLRSRELPPVKAKAAAP